jgi:branched-chain amino acid transport system substrate-binding protein
MKRVLRPEKRAQDDNATVLVPIRSRALLRFALGLLTFAFASCLLGALSNACFAQAPYAAIDRDAVRYNGPGRDASHDLAGKQLCIGLLLPLTGTRVTEGEALRRAAQMAIDKENASARPGSDRLRLAVRDEAGQWGQASEQIAHILFDDEAVAIITSPESSAAHLAEQVANKIGVPVLTLSADSTTTEINLPWIFRIGATDAAQAAVFARDIYETRKLRRVLLVTQDDRDGRLGGEEFVKAARAHNAEAPATTVVSTDETPSPVAWKSLEAAQAVVVWSDAPMAARVAESVRARRPGVPIYFCRKAWEGDPAETAGTISFGSGLREDNQWTTAAPADRAVRDEFRKEYRQLYGLEPSMDAAQIYDAVRIIAASLRKTGPNRARLRDALAGVSNFAGASGVISFDHAGNDLSRITLVHVD